MSTIFITLYDENQLINLPNTLDKINLIRNDGDIILSIFNNLYYTESNIDMYENLLRSYEDYHYIKYSDFNNSLKNILESYINRYNKFIVLNGNLLILDGIKNIIGEHNLSCKNNQSSGLLIFNKSDIITLIRNNTTLDNLSNQCYKITTNTIITEYLIDQSQIICSTKPQEIFYENEYCLFCILSKKDSLKESVIYMNKNNKKIFNVENNIFGIITQYSGDTMTVEWKINDKSQKYSYVKNGSIFI